MTIMIRRKHIIASGKTSASSCPSGGNEHYSLYTELTLLSFRPSIFLPLIILEYSLGRLVTTQLKWKEL